jgi:thiol-disulfide isomerase/thioredoxin
MFLRLNTPLPDFSGATEWINGQPDRASLAGQPVLVYFWSVSCHLCHEAMPKIARWREKYASQGLKLVAIHMPRQETDTEIERVREMVRALGITDPCGVDNRHTVKQAFVTSYVPAYFLFDREGKLRGRAGGEAGLAQLEQTLKRQFETEETAPIAQPQPILALG